MIKLRYHLIYCSTPYFKMIPLEDTLSASVYIIRTQPATTVTIYYSLSTSHTEHTTRYQKLQVLYTTA